MAQFRALVTDQVRRNLRSVLDRGHFALESVEHVVDDTAFPRALTRHPALSHHAVLTWHATQDVNKVRSIAKHGYVVPGDIVPTQAFSLKMQNGAYFGEGVYSSSRFDFAKWFSFLDRDGTVQLLLNWVSLGQVHWVADDPPERVVVKDVSGFNTVTRLYWRKQTVIDNPEFDRGIFTTVDGVFGNGAHTRLLRNLEIVVSGDAARVVPIAIVTLRPNFQSPLLQTYLVATPPFRGRGGKTLVRAGRRFEFDDDDRKHAVKLFRMCGDWHVLAPPARAQSTDFELRHHFVVPLRLARGGDATVAQQIASLFGALVGSKRLTLHDGSALETFAGAESADQFASHVAGVKARGSGVQTHAALASVLDTVTRTEREVFEVVHLVLDDDSLVADGAAVTALLEQFTTLLAVRRLVVKLVCVGDECGSQSALLRVKFALQTEDEVYERLVHHVAAPTEWAGVVDTLIEENATLANVHRAGARYDVPSPFGCVGEGFVVDLVFNPIWGEQRLPEHALYKGSQPLPALLVNGMLHAVQYVTRESIVALLTKRAPKVESEIERLKRESDVIFAAAEYGALVSSFSEALLRVLCRFRSHVIRSKGRMKQYGAVVQELCRALVAEVELVETLDALTSRFDFGQLRRALHTVQALVSDINTFADVPLSGAWWQQLLSLRFAKAIAKRAQIDETEVDLATLTDAHGVRVVVHTSNAVQIEPWLLIVERVTLERASVAEAVSGHFALLPDSDESSDTRLRAFWAQTFTGNPHLFLPAQPIALLTVTWVRALEALFRGDTAASREAWAQAWTLAERVRGAFQRDVVMREQTLPNIGRAALSSLAQHLTEPAGCTSLCRLLGALTLSEARQHVSFDANDARFSTLAFAMLCEAVRRGSRSYLAQHRATANDELRRVLGVEVGKENETLDVDACAARTGRFFRGAYSNASPFAIVAALAFLERWHAGADVERVAADFAARELVSMRRFLTTHLPGFDGRVTQLALFVQALRFARTAQRGAFRFADPLAIVRDAFDEQVAMAAAAKRVLDAALNRTALRTARRLAAVEPFKFFHARVRLFTWAEVDELNSKIADRSQWIERLDNGMLKHHCAAPACPSFLQFFATASDLRNGRRNGIMRHLSKCQAAGAYVPGLHLQARAFADRALPAFLAAMERKFGENAAFQRMADREATLREIWTFFQATVRK